MVITENGCLVAEAPLDVADLVLKPADMDIDYLAKDITVYISYNNAALNKVFDANETRYLYLVFTFFGERVALYQYITDDDITFCGDATLTTEEHEAFREAIKAALPELAEIDDAKCG